MRREVIHGGWYPAALPLGEFAVVRHDDAVLLTHLGPLTPGERILFPTLTTVGGFKIAGQTHADPPRVIEYAEGQWRTRLDVACGVVNPLIYDHDGRLLGAAPGSPIGSQGYRYIDAQGHYVTGDWTYGPRDGIDLFGWTDIPGVGRFGQGPDDNGFWFYDEQTRLYYEVIDGFAQFGRVQFDGTTLAIACWVQPHRAEILWATPSEIRAGFVGQASPKKPVRYAPVVPIGRYVRMGWFFGTGAEPANCHFVDPTFTGHTFIQGPEWRYVAGASDGNVADIEAAIAAARPEGHPVLAYVPRGAQHALPTSADVQGIECYLGTDETDAQFVRRIQAAIDASPRCVLIPQVYTSNATHTTDLRRLPGLTSALGRDNLKVEGVFPFSGAGRGTGWGDHPEVHDAWQQVFAGITGTPSRSEPTPEPTEPNEPELPEAPALPNPDNTPESGNAPKPTMTQPPFTRPEPVRPDRPIGGNAVADFFRALGKINFRKLFEGWFR